VMRPAKRGIPRAHAEMSVSGAGPGGSAKEDVTCAGSGMDRGNRPGLRRGVPPPIDRSASVRPGTPGAGPVTSAASRSVSQRRWLFDTHARGPQHAAHVGDVAAARFQRTNARRKVPLSEI
jgi:hypothetical protein